MSARKTSLLPTVLLDDPFQKSSTALGELRSASSSSSAPRIGARLTALPRPFAFVAANKGSAASPSSSSSSERISADASAATSASTRWVSAASPALVV